MGDTQGHSEDGCSEEDDKETREGEGQCDQRIASTDHHFFNGRNPEANERITENTTLDYVQMPDGEPHKAYRAMGDRGEAALHRHNVSSSSVKPSVVGKFVGTTSPSNLSKKEAEVLAQIKIVKRRLEDLRSEYERAVVKMQAVCERRDVALLGIRRILHPQQT